MNGQQGQPRSKAPSKGMRMWIIAAVVAVAVVIVAAYFLLSYNQPATRYLKLAALLSGGKKVSLLTVANTLGINTSAQALTGHNYGGNAQPVNATYSGSGSFGIKYSIFDLSVPFKYATVLLQSGNYSRIGYNVTLSGVHLLGTEVQVPGMSYLCSDQNQSLASLLPALGLAPQQNSSPDYRCVLQSYGNQQPQFGAQSIGPINESSAIRLSGMVRKALGAIYLNATSVSQASYGGSGCMKISGYVSSNSTALYDLLYQNSTGAGLASMVPANTSITLGGPYSICISPTSGMLYEYNLTQSFSYGAAQYRGAVNMSLSGTETSFGPAPSQGQISELPYPVLNGTCAAPVQLEPVGYPQSFVPAYYGCHEVDMNSTGYLRVGLSPSAGALSALGGSSAAAAPSTVRLLGLACTSGTSASSYGSYNFSSMQQAPAASAYEPLNMTFGSNSAVTLIAKCPAPTGEAEYTAYLYGISAENYSGTMYNVSSEVATVTVIPTVKGLLGKNLDTGPVAHTVSISNTTQPLSNATNSSSLQYNYTNATCTPVSGTYTCGNATILSNSSITPQSGIPSGAQYFLYLGLSASAAPEYNISVECGSAYNPANATPQYGDLMPGSQLYILGSCLGTPHGNSDGLWVEYYTSYNSTASLHSLAASLSAT